MLYKHLVITSAILVVFSTVAFADSLSDVQPREPVIQPTESVNVGLPSQINATVMLEFATYSYSRYSDYDNQEISVSVSGNFSSRFGMQLDTQYLNWVDYDSSYEIFGATFHLTSDLSKSLSVGAFYNFSSWEGDRDDQRGFEASFQTKNIKLDAIMAWEVYNSTPKVIGYQAIFLDYNLLDNLTIGFGLGHYDDYATTEEVSATYHFKNGNNLKLKAIDTKEVGDILTIAWSKDFGQGSKFRRPDYTSIFNTWW